ncbi:MAG: adenylate kinase [Sulfobacillus acidophilus]|uniref:Adenylate kinase n=1 Tax=Sulfobacillus acidophilus TaxID=53633 RepID=A0A2T2WGM0_9FIRM|nr:MAG: adenylate kinase [Sulfobacillus acidophilus]
MQIVLLGPPGSGKGTQAKILARQLGVPHISTGDLFRQHLHEGTPLGVAARRYLDAGTLVPDDVTESMVRARIQEPDARVGFILDGFPRNLSQAQHFETILSDLERALSVVIYLAVQRHTLMMRLTGRRVCPQCGALYHVQFNPPLTQGLCNVCGAQLAQRPDDREDTVATRLSVYDAETKPLIDFYRQRGLLQEIDGELPVDAVTQSIGGALAMSHD